ncbi:MAG: radical SAM protein [Clostridia bacterium]|jgi:oxygen-independent coproporphyrinogen-3 oxidase|nr:radical SAM protein [Clostridia bacterium]
MNIYIHIPFCKSKCYYCDFFSKSNQEKLEEDYVDAQIEEIEHEGLEKYDIETVYIGGGTPSILSSRNIGRIIQKIRKSLDKNAEITIEVNPGTVSYEDLEDYISFGINRISIGLQTAENRLLKEIRKNTYL